MAQKCTVKDIMAMKSQGKKISMLTAYDAAMAKMLDDAGIDILLVGDSLGMVLLGYDSTVPVTMEEMLHHSRAVTRGREKSLVVGDMPFGSYQSGLTKAVDNGVRFMKEAGCDAVKLEGGEEMCDVVRALTRAGVPVMGHVGLTPQTAGQLGGFKVQGRDIESARKMVVDAKALADAGVFAIVLECVPGELAGIVTRSVDVPTIGIGAGSECDGQVLVTNDLLGMFEKFTPVFVKQYAHLSPQIGKAVASFRDEVETGAFPTAEHTFDSNVDLESLLKDME